MQVPVFTAVSFLGEVWEPWLQIWEHVGYANHWFWLQGTWPPMLDWICWCEEALGTQGSPAMYPGCQSHSCSDWLFCPALELVTHPACPLRPSLAGRTFWLSAPCPEVMSNHLDSSVLPRFVRPSVTAVIAVGHRQGTEHDFQCHLLPMWQGPCKPPRKMLHF